MINVFVVLVWSLKIVMVWDVYNNNDFKIKIK